MNNTNTTTTAAGIAATLPRGARVTMSEQTSSLEVGTEVYYTGDMANAPGAGRITAIRDSEWGRQLEIALEAEPSKFGPEYGIEARTFTVSPSMFSPQPGRRFWTMAERREWKRAEMAKLRASIGRHESN